MLRVLQVDSTMEISFNHYQLTLKQMLYAAHPRYVINRQRSNYFPFIIVKDDEIIGAFALERGDILIPINAPTTAICLRDLSFDRPHQKKGYFKQVIKAVEQYINRQDSSITDLYVMVNVHNDDAYYAFIRAGFKDQQRTVKRLYTLKVLAKSIIQQS